MFRKSKTKERELLYKARIKELENIICPGEQHKYALVDEAQIMKDYGVIVYHRRYVCERCLKAKENADFI